MKKFKKLSAALLVAAMLMTMAACSKTAPEESNVAETGVSESAPLEETATTSDGQTFEDLYGTQLGNYINHQYYFEGEPLSMVETNYYFIQSFTDLCSYAMYYQLPMTTEGFLDLSADYESEDENDRDLGTWGDFLVDYAEAQIENTQIMLGFANDAGIALTADDIAEIDGFFVDLQTESVDPTGMTMDEYLELYFGNNCTEDELKEVMSKLRIVELYMTDYVDNYEYDESEIMVPNLRYALFYAPAGSTEEVMSSQESACQEFLDSCTDLEMLQVNGAIASANGSVYEYGDEIAVERGVMVPEFEAWAYDESREVGDIDMILTERFGYFTVGYLGLTEVSEDSMKRIAVRALNSEVQALLDAGAYEFYTTDEYEPAPAITTPVPTYDNLTVIRNEEDAANAPKAVGNYFNIIIAAILGVTAAGIIGAGVYGSIKDKKEKEGANTASNKNKKKKKK